MNFSCNFLHTKLAVLALLSTILLSVASPAHANHEDDKSIRVVNNTSETWVYYVYITPAGTDYWGPDQLTGDNTVLAPNGESRTWTIPWDGCYIDIKAVSEGGHEVARFYVDVCGGGKTWYLTD